jgi:TIR domain-containing protein
VSLIFFSWASSDKDVVDGFLGRLRDLGMGSLADAELPQLWEYRHEMAAGDIIPATVDSIIKQADMAIFCLSDAALEHKWIVTETTLAFSAQQDASRKLKHIIPVKVGPVTPEKLKEIQHVVASPNQFLADVSSGSEEELLKVAKDVFAKLATKPPKLLPIAVIAMTDDQAEQQFKVWKEQYREQAKAVWNACRAAGMKDPPELFTAFHGRYGKRPEDMKPFKSAVAAPDPALPADPGAAVAASGQEGDALPADESVRDIVHALIRQVNRARVAANERPVFPRWIHGELFGGNKADRNRAEEYWTSNDSLLIVDLISAFNDEVQKQLAGLPPIPDRSRTATLCVPPYTQHTREIEDRLEQLADDVSDLRFLFRDWSNPDRMVAFDTATSVSLRLWLHRRLITVPDTDPPVEQKVRGMPAGRRSMPRQTG